MKHIVIVSPYDSLAPMNDPREEANRLHTLYPDAPPAFLAPPPTVELLHDNQEVT